MVATGISSIQPLTLATMFNAHTMLGDFLFCSVRLYSGSPAASRHACTVMLRCWALRP